MRLYHHPASSNARRVVMTAKLLNVPLELVEIDLADEGERRRLGELNPNAMVPVLQDGDFMLWESCAIMQYLADLSPGQTLYPHEARARADVNRWMFWACQHFSPAIGVMTWENIWKSQVGAGDTDLAELARGEREVLRFGQVLDRHLAGRDYRHRVDHGCADGIRPTESEKRSPESAFIVAV
ncbi:glutathione S-transferase family protein [Massilia sp. PAMC28688]|uniref:glutathione S-transferase family protein n=1 Tax=Massilia sp. PAMC28688 TaxID=2861283 RepID=UPI001C625190|nr:glutathione S-transferase family protein [Massilia sp. PAMC28688]QYF95502.1 glutathione S-transferase family protein [Massilia sp. PAMC28688]